jgi:hypothetical protein
MNKQIPKLLGLTDQELDALLDFVHARVAPCDRARFLVLVSAELLASPSVDMNHTLHAVVGRMRADSSKSQGGRSKILA